MEEQRVDGTVVPRFRVLFLAMSFGSDNVRDNVTYPFLLREIRELANRDVEVFFIRTDGAQTTHGGLVHYISIDDLLEKSRVRRRVSTLRFIMKNLASLFEALTVSPKRTYHMCEFERVCERAISLFSIEIIHTHFGFPGGGNAFLCAKGSRVPVVSTLRGSEILNRPDLDYGAMRSRHFRRLFSRTILTCRRITVPNRNMMEYLVTELGVNKARVQYLPNGVNVGSFKTVPPTPKKIVNCIAIGHFIKLKNFGFLLTAMAPLLRQNKLSLRLVGKGPLKEELLAQIKNGEYGSVELLPEMPSVEVYKLISASDCLIHPSLSEGMPNVVLESLALGRPCLVSDIPAHREIIEQDVNGFFFNPFNSASLTQILERIAENPSSLRNMYTTCTETANRFTVSRKIQGYLDIYSDISNCRANYRRKPGA